MVEIKCSYCGILFKPKSKGNINCSSKCTKNKYANSTKGIKQNKQWILNNPQKRKDIANTWARKAQKEGRSYRQKNPEKCAGNDYIYYIKNQKKLYLKGRKYIFSTPERLEASKKSKKKYQDKILLKYKKENNLRCKIYQRFKIHINLKIIIDNYELINNKYENGKLI